MVDRSCRIGDSSLGKLDYTRFPGCDSVWEDSVSDFLGVKSRDSFSEAIVRNKQRTKQVLPAIAGRTLLGNKSSRIA